MSTYETEHDGNIITWRDGNITSEVPIACCETNRRTHGRYCDGSCELAREQRQAEEPVDWQEFEAFAADPIRYH